MTATDGAFAQWLSQAQIAEDRLTAEQRGLLQARLCLPATLRRRLLFQPSAQPFPAALRLRTQGRSDRPLGRHQPAHGLAAARRLFQGGDSGGAPPHGRPAPRQTAAALCRPHRRVHPDPCRRHAATTCSTSSSAPGACASPRWPCTIFARSSASIGPRGPRPRPPAQRGPHAAPSRARVETAPPSQPVPLPPPPFSRRGRNTRGRSC